eukprot:6483248-Amphidinium_carterae.2
MAQGEDEAKDADSGSEDQSNSDDNSDSQDQDCYETSAYFVRSAYGSFKFEPAFSQLRQVGYGDNLATVKIVCWSCICFLARGRDHHSCVCNQSCSEAKMLRSDELSVSITNTSAHSPLLSMLIVGIVLNHHEHSPTRNLPKGNGPKV